MKLKVENVELSTSSETKYSEGLCEIKVGKELVEVTFTLVEMLDYNNGHTERIIENLDCPDGVDEKELGIAILKEL